VGGLYGVSIGRTFFGESMFSTRANDSKAALITLVSGQQELRFNLIDCQVETPHLASLGARFIPRKEFRSLLKESLRHETFRGNWGMLSAPCLLPEQDIS
jgi:leucyl/phenylalanyl-tRNA--protein transferase